MNPICYLCEHFEATEVVIPASSEAIALCPTCFEQFPDEFVIDTYSL